MGMGAQQLLTQQGNLYKQQKGLTLKERTTDFKQWVDQRREAGVWSYNRVLDSAVSESTHVITDSGASKPMMNLATQDNLGMIRRHELQDAATDAMHSHGIHTGCSASLAGTNSITSEIERKLVKVTGCDEAILFNTGWAACYGAIRGLVTQDDHLVLDVLSHNCLQEASQLSTSKRYTFMHNDMSHLEQRLSRIRNADQSNAVFIITEGLFSMHGDSPDPYRLVELAKKYNAILILDLSHDFGSEGEKGLGLLEYIPKDFFESLVVVGSFSKTFASVGGFVLGPEGVRDRLVCFSPTYMFSLAMTPMSSGIINKSMDLVFSDEGLKLRKKLKQNINFARTCLKAQGIDIIGHKGPVVPVMIGDQQIARIATKELFESGILVNLIEFPAVPLEHSMFRLQISAAFSFSFILDFAKKLGRALDEARSAITVVTKNEPQSDLLLTQ